MADANAITKDFLRAAERNDADAAAAYLAGGAHVNASDQHGATALIWAARHGNIPLAEKLLAEGAERECRDNMDFTPLLAAISLRQEEMACSLIRWKFNAAASGGRGETALVMAAEWGNATVAKMLLSAGADPDAQDGACNRPLPAAAHIGSLDVVKLLLDAGADVNARDGDGRTAFIHAVTAGNLDMAKELLRRGADVSICDFRGRSALELARQWGNAELSGLIAASFADYDLPQVTEGLRKPFAVLPKIKLKGAE